MLRQECQLSIMNNVKLREQENSQFFPSHSFTMIITVFFNKKLFYLPSHYDSALYGSDISEKIWLMK